MRDRPTRERALALLEALRHPVGFDFEFIQALALAEALAGQTDRARAALRDGEAR